MRKQDKEQDRQ